MKKVVLVCAVLASFVLIFHVGSVSTGQQETADLVIFSYDRPLQLYALLESIQKYMTGIGHASVIYRASNDQFRRGYELVHKDFPHIFFLAQGAMPANDFKPLTLKATFESPSTYILFAVDDIVVKDFVDVAQCIRALEQHKAYAFFLRLGKNLNYCYSMNRQQPLPQLKNEGGAVLSWQFHGAKFDWCYPNTVDMTLYRKKDIEGHFKTLSYHSPNKLEGLWSCFVREVILQRGLCFETSKVVNTPLNRVQDEYKNRCMEISAQDLMNIFVEGKKMDIAQLHRIDNKSAHMEYQPQFINRS